MAPASSAVLALLVLVAGVSASGQDADGGKNRPVTKVINILKEMTSQLEKEGEEDEEAYQAMGCWCTTNEQEKTEQIAAGDKSINNLVAKIEELTANSARLNTEIANLNKEEAKNGEALDAATALRAKQLAEFNAEEKDMLQSITSMKGAVIALKKHNSAFLQATQTGLDMQAAGVAAAVTHELEHHANLLAGFVTPHQRKLLAAFAAAPETHMRTALLQTEDQAPQSGEIFGILSAMKESFETNLAASQKEEDENNKAYEELKAAKEAEIAAGQEQVDSKTQELADTDERNAQAKQNLDDTRSLLAANTEYLANLKETCKNADSEYEERTKTRELEKQAISKALEFLSGDAAHDLFTKTFNPALLQAGLSSHGAGARTERSHAVAVLASAAKVSKDPRLSTLATSVRVTQNFDAVKETIQTMITNLESENADEIKLRDFCVKSFSDNEDETTSTTRDKADLETKVADLQSTIDELTKEIDALKAAIADNSLQLKIAGEDREKANTEFQTMVSEQRATQKILTAALDALKGFYDKAALVQAKQPVGPPPPGGFKTYEKNEKSGGVMGMIQGIIDEAKTMEEEGTRAEVEAQADYEKFVSDTNVELDALNLDLANKVGVRGKTEEEKVETEGELQSAIDGLSRLASELSDLHTTCDYTMKNFDARQETRTAEIDALKQSIAIFSGAKFAAFVQTLK